MDPRTGPSTAPPAERLDRAPPSTRAQRQPGLVPRLALQPRGCESSRRSVGAPFASPVDVLVERSSRSSLPASRSCMIETAVKVFVIEPIAVLRVGRRVAAVSASAAPTARPTTRSLPCGRRQRRGSAGVRPADSGRAARASQAGARPRLRAPAAPISIGALDVLVADVEVRDGAQDRPGRRCSRPTPASAEPLDRLRLRKPERTRGRAGRSSSRPARGRPAARLSSQPSASRRARAWSSARRSTLWSSAYTPAAATIPACRIAPPKRCFSTPRAPPSARASRRRRRRADSRAPSRGTA